MTSTLHVHEQFDPVLHVAEIRTADKLAAKVAWPALVLAGLGVILLVVGVILANEALVTVGVSLLGASGVTAGVGYQAPAPTVEHHVPDTTEERTSL